MKKIFNTPIFFSNQASFVEKGREAFAALQSAEADKFIDQIVSSYNNSVKLLDRYTFFAYVFSTTFYFAVKGYIKIESIAFIKVADANVIPSTFPFIVLFLTSFSLMHFVYANKLYFLIESFSYEKRNSLYTDKMFVFYLNLHSFTFLCESSRYNKFSLVHCLRHLVVFALFLGFIFCPNFIVFSLHENVTSSFDDKILDYFVYVYYGLCAWIVLLVSVVFVIVSDAVGRNKTM